jgi:hypothetical protein
MTIPNAATESKPSRPLLRLSVRGLMLLVLVLAVVLGLFVRRAQVQREAVAAIRQSGGTVYYDWQQTHGKPGQPVVDPMAEPIAPKWLVELLGVDYFGDVMWAVPGKQGTDDTMAHVGRLPKLISVGISQSDAITEAGIAHLAGLSDLEMVNFKGLKGTGAALAYLRGHTKLKRLHIDGVLVTDADLVHLDGLTSLEWLNLPSTQVSDAGLVHMERLVNLRQLVLNDTRVVGPGLAHLKGMAQLEGLHLARTLVRDLSSLPPLPRLESLTLDDTEVDDSQMPSVARFPALDRLNLNHTGVTDVGLVALQGAKGSLRGLFLTGTKVTDAAAPALLKLEHLAGLSLADTKITDATLDQLSGLNGLRALDVSQTAVTDEGIARLRKALPRLKVTNKAGAARANPASPPINPGARP